MATRTRQTKAKSKKAANKKKGAIRKKSSKKAASKKSYSKSAPAPKRASKPKKFPPVRTSADLAPKASRAVKAAADALWGVGVTPHVLLKELHEVLLLRCLSEAQGNYASAAKLFGPSRQSVQQYANSNLRDARWAPYQQNQRNGG